MSSRDTREWTWDGGRPSIDFLNTLRDRKAVPWDLLVEPADLAEWLTLAKLVAAPVQVSAGQLARARELRDAIDRVALAAAAGRAVDTENVAALNAFAKVRAAPAELSVGKGGRLELRAALEKNPVGVAFGILAADAIDLVTSRPEGFHVCASDTCGLRFEDRSPAGNRQWCSMKRCGNREKARLHYLRSK